MIIKQIPPPDVNLFSGKDPEDISAIDIVLGNRGVFDPDFFNLSWADVQDPRALDNADLAVAKIKYHCHQGNTIGIICDCDMDGFTSCALLTNFLTRHAYAGDFDGLVPDIQILHHDDKTHGLSDVKVMKELRDNIKPALLIIPDASGTEEQYLALSALGIDIVVIDHHDTEERGDGDKVIVVNNQQSEKYQNKALSGVGVVWQVCRLMDAIYQSNVANDYLDIVACGLVADVMDLRSRETRFLVQEGLKPDNIRSPLIRQALFSNDYKLQGTLTPTKVAFNIAPLVNAVTRIGTQEEKRMLFGSLLDDAFDVQVPNGKRGATGEIALVTEAYRLITNAKSRQTRRQDKLMELIDSLIQEEGLLENKVLIVALGKDDYEAEHRGLAGLVCNKLQDFYQRPAMILFQNDDGSYSGSVRAPEAIEAFANFKDQCNESGLFRFALGHQAAFGCACRGSDLGYVEDFFNKKYDGLNLEPSYKCDFIINAADPGAVEDVIFDLSGHDDIWGQGLKEPIIALENVLIGPGSIDLVGQGKGRPTLRIKTGGAVCIRFGSSKEEFDSLLLPYDSNQQYYRATIVGRAQVNEFRGTKTPQLLIQDYEIHGVTYDF